MFVCFDHFADFQLNNVQLGLLPMKLSGKCHLGAGAKFHLFVLQQLRSPCTLLQYCIPLPSIYTASFDFIPLPSIYTASIILLPSAFLSSACQRSCGGNPGTISSGSSLTTRGSAPKQASTTGCRPCASGCWGVSIETPTWASPSATSAPMRPCGPRNPLPVSHQSTDAPSTRSRSGRPRTPSPAAPASGASLQSKGR